MPHSSNKIEWCLRKAEKEIKDGHKHRGLLKIKPDTTLAEEHILKAEHNLNAINDFKKIGYSDWSASAAFYSIYHCFLAVITKFGYESRNQECTFALIYHLIESKKIDFDINIVREIYDLNPEEKHESSSIVDVRESGQYGIKLSIEDKTFDKLIKMAKIILDKTKEILEK